MASDLSERRAALRALLVEQAVAAPRRRIRPRDAEPGRLRMAVVTGAVAVAVVAATAVALQLPGGAFHGAPVGGASPVPATSSALPTQAPTASPTSTPEATRPPVADPTPSTAVSEAPVPTRTPAAPPTATSTPPAGLITPTGFQRITREQLHDFVVGRGFSAVWEEQAWLDIGCMADHGFVYDPIAESSAPVSWKDGLTAEQQQAYDEAMYGPRTDQPYDWRTAGCHGLSVHETGMDDAN